MMMHKGAQRPSARQASLAAPHVAAQQRRARLRAPRAEGDKPEGSGPKGDASAPLDDNRQQVQKAIDAMKRDGVDSDVARKVLKAWQDDKGVQDSKGLRNQVFGFGVSLVGVSALQLLTDVLGSYSANQTAIGVSLSGFTGSGIVAIVLQTLSIYFTINAFLDTFRLGSVIASTALTGARSEALYQAIEELADEQSSIQVVNKAQAAVNTSKVVLAINSVRTALREEMESGGGFKVGTLSTLTSLFVLQHAKEKYGWTPEGAGISESKAAEAAATFGKFDVNEDNRLEFSEFKKLCNAADFSLTDEESKEAIKLLDKRGSGFVEFDEFCSWWVEKGSPLEAAKKQEAVPA